MYEDGVKTRPIASTVNPDGTTNLYFAGPNGTVKTTPTPVAGVPAGAVRSMQDSQLFGPKAVNAAAKQKLELNADSLRLLDSALSGRGAP